MTHTQSTGMTRQHFAKTGMPARAALLVPLAPFAEGEPGPGGGSAAGT